MNHDFSNTQQLSRHLEGIFSISRECLAITDLTGNVLKANHAWKTILGYNTAQLEGHNLFDVIYPNDRERLHSAFSQLSTQDELLDLPCRLLAQNGSNRIVLWNFKRLGETVYGTARDLSELYEAKNETHSVMVLNKQLYSILANEMQIPLKSLTLFQDLFEKTPNPTDQQTCMENIRLSTQLLEHLIAGMTAFHEEKSGRPLEMVSFDFYAAIEDAIIPLIASAKIRKIALDLRIHPRTPQRVVGDPKRFMEILSFLVINSLELANQGKITIDFSPENTNNRVFKVYASIVISETDLSKTTTTEPDLLKKLQGQDPDKIGSVNFGLDVAKRLVSTMNGELTTSRGNKGEILFSFHVLLLKDESRHDKQENMTPQRVLPAYNKNLRLKEEELKAIDRILKDQSDGAGSETAPQKQRLLIIDDAQDATTLLHNTLKSKYDILTANSGKDGLKLAHARPHPDMILLDMTMPELNGYEVCRRLHLEEDTKDIPIIFITTLPEAESEAFSLKSGAVDFIRKPFDLLVVAEKIRNHLALKQYREMLNETADLDYLTQIANRRRFNEMLAVEIRKARRMKTSLSVIIVDIDYFRRYNEIYGHIAGDGCLREVASILKKKMRRAGDLVARWGGEEFACLLPDTDLKGAAHVAENLRIAVIEMGIPHHASPIAKSVTLSVGVSSGTDSDEGSLESLTENAESALIQSKISGRNRISVFSQS
jgi:diguanylate cyclase (GGDEF)-like protein/PAS domain S-box-containing protein